jgi:hypothetical protein
MKFGVVRRGKEAERDQPERLFCAGWRNLGEIRKISVRSTQETVRVPGPELVADRP